MKHLFRFGHKGPDFQKLYTYVTSAVLDEALAPTQGYSFTPANVVMMIWSSELLRSGNHDASISGLVKSTALDQLATTLKDFAEDATRHKATYCRYDDSGEPGADKMALARQAIAEAVRGYRHIGAHYSPSYRAALNVQNKLGHAKSTSCLGSLPRLFLRFIYRLFGHTPLPA